MKTPSQNTSQGSIAWFAKNHVAANILMCAVLLFGLFSLQKIPMEVFPEFELDTIFVQTSYFGASPREILESLSLPIENALSEVEGIKSILSTSQENSSSLSLEVDSFADTEIVKEQVIQALSGLNDLPLEAKEPSVQIATRDRSVISVVLYGQATPEQLLQQAELLKSHLQQNTQVEQLSILNPPQKEIEIAVSELSLIEHGLSFAEIKNAINGESSNISNGTLSLQSKDVFLRTLGDKESLRSLAQTVLRQNSNGSQLLLEDVASSISEDYSQDSVITRIDGSPAIFVEAYRIGNQSAIQLAEEVKQSIPEFAQSLPENMQVRYWNDRSRIIKSRLGVLLDNALMSGLLVFLLLTLFLRLKVALWISLGIPFSFVASFIVLPYAGISFNLVSLMGYIIVLGIVVDDAIVTGENIYTHFQRGEDTCYFWGFDHSAFTLEGVRGQIFALIPSIVIPVLLFSLVHEVCPACPSQNHQPQDYPRRPIYSPWLRALDCQQLFAFFASSHAAPFFD